jgi:hypothetical protein
MLEVVPPERITNRYPGLVLDLLSMAFSIGKIGGKTKTADFCDLTKTWNEQVGL